MRVLAEFLYEHLFCDERRESGTLEGFSELPHVGCHALLGAKEEVRHYLAYNICLAFGTMIGENTSGATNGS